MPLDSRKFVVVHVQLSQIAVDWQRHKIPNSKKRQNLYFFAARGLENKPIETILA